MRRLAVALIAAAVATDAVAAEGMWTLDNLPREALATRHGFTPEPGWTERLMKASVRLAGGCSGAFVSPDGLVMTNAHCAIGCVQELSSRERDYVNQGFVARRRSDEPQCPTVELNRLEAVSDVTARLQETLQGLEGKEFTDAKNAEKASIESECVGKDSRNVRCDVVELYHGGVYQLYRYRRFQDVRLVFSPEHAVGAFGGDPDNFNFPRYTFDVAFLRAYADGKPAQVGEHLRLTRAGVKDGDLTFITGHPGTTERQFTVAQLERRRDVDLISVLTYLAERRGMLNQYARGSAEAARLARADIQGTENSYKVYTGQLQALLRPALLEAKREEERALRTGAGAEAIEAWDAIAAAQATWRDIETVYNLIEKNRGFYSTYFTLARHLVRAAEERGRPNAERLREYQDAGLPRLQQLLFSRAPVYPEYEKTKLAWSLGKLRELMGVDDPLVKLVLGKESPERLAARLVDGTQLASVEARRALRDGGAEAVAQSRDPFIQLARAVDGAARAVRREYESKVEAVENQSAAAIAQARFARYGTSVYPDATFTLRLSYGTVQGWSEKGKAITPFTDLAGAFARHTGEDPFALPPSWLKARDRLALATPYNFVATLDLTGGNSGSPVLDRAGRVVGVAFDGNIHSLGGAFGYDESLNRAVVLDARAILEALAKVYDAGALVQELGAR